MSINKKGMAKGLVVAALLCGISHFGIVACSDTAPSSSSSVQDSSVQEDVDAVVYDRISWSEYIFGDDTFENVEDEVTRNWVISDAERQSLVPRGKYLVRAVAACGYCHGAASGNSSSPASDNQSSDVPLIGGRTITISGEEFVAPNITPHKESGIGAWSLPEIVGVIRGGLGRDGHSVSSEVHGDFRWLSDQDARAIAAYLLTLPPVDRKLESEVSADNGGLDSQRSQLKQVGDSMVGYIPQPPQTQSADYGMYLARYVAGCSRCHTKDGGTFSDDVPFSGAEEITDADNSSVAHRLESAPDIRGGASGTRLHNWKVEDYVNYLTDGSAPDGSKRSAALCPLQHYSGMSDRDKRAIALFLKKLQ